MVHPPIRGQLSTLECHVRSEIPGVEASLNGTNKKRNNSNGGETTRAENRARHAHNERYKCGPLGPNYKQGPAAFREVPDLPQRQALLASLGRRIAGEGEKKRAHLFFFSEQPCGEGSAYERTTEGDPHCAFLPRIERRFLFFVCFQEDPLLSGIRNRFRISRWILNCGCGGRGGKKPQKAARLFRSESCSLEEDKRPFLRRIRVCFQRTWLDRFLKAPPVRYLKGAKC